MTDDIVEKIILIDIDPEITKICSNHPEIVELNQGSLLNTKVTVINQDAYKFVEWGYHNQKFDENFVKDLKLNMPDMVYVYSQNSASSFLNFIKIYQSKNLWMNTNLLCISEKTSSILNEIKWKKIFLFNPGEEEFLLYKI